MTAAFSWPDGYRAAACFTFDVDAESPILFEHPEAAGWLDVMTHQEYGPRTGMPRILRLLDRQQIRATFFVPGYTAERWPDAVKAIRDGGHEIACHGYLHEGSRGADPATEERRLVRALQALDSVDVTPMGYRAPNWEASYALPPILAKHGLRYDSSLMDSDWPYRLAAADEAHAPTLIELPVHWSLDDWEPYVYLPGISGTGLIASPTELTARWSLELDALVDEGGLFMLTNHPFVSGRASRAAALERLIERARDVEGVWIATCDEVATHAESLDLEPVVHGRPELPASE